MFLENKENLGPHSSRGQFPTRASTCSIKQSLKNLWFHCQWGQTPSNTPSSSRGQTTAFVLSPWETDIFPMKTSISKRHTLVPQLCHPTEGNTFLLLLKKAIGIFFKSFTLMASFIHYLTNTNHTSIKSQPLYFGWGLHLYIKCAKAVCLEGSYNQVKIKKKTLYPTVQRLRLVREQYCYLYLLDMGSSCWHLRQRKRFLLTPEEDFLIYIETLGPLGCLLFSCFW